MRNIFTLIGVIALFFIAKNANAQAFITTWKTDNTGTSNSTSITIPTTGTGYYYDVDWNNDGIFDQFGITGSVTHDFGVIGTYTIRIQGNFPRIYFNNSGDRLKLLNISQWGNIVWTSMENAFSSCFNLNITALDAPNLSSVNNLSYMFAYCSNFNANINHWNTSNVTDMSFMFDGATTFNQPLNNWNTANVIDMNGMFYGASAFNQPLDNWNTSNVTNMVRMFRSAVSFNQNLNNWNTGNVTNMSLMFYDASIFNQPLNNWNTANVTDMSGMFFKSTDFNQPLNNWNTANVTNMAAMFLEARVFNQNINTWNTSNVTNMADMFLQATAFNQPLNNWNTANVTNMRGMFAGANVFNQPLNNWNTANVIDMRGMFFNSNVFNQNLGNWNIGKVTDMSFMLYNSGLDIANYDATLIGWQAQNVQPNVPLDATGLKFCAAAVQRGNLITNSNWIITGDIRDCGAPFITTWKTDNTGTSNSTSITIPTTGSGYYYNIDWNNDGIFDQFGITGSVTHNFVTAGTYTIRIQGNFPRIYFNNAGDRLKLLNINQWGADIKWTSMENAFYGCSNLNSIATDAPNLTSVSSLRAMFNGCSNFNANINHWNVSTITNMSYLFYNASTFNQPLNNWNTANVTSMAYMFTNATAFNQNISNWNTGNVTSTILMFSGATAFNQNISNWNTGNVTIMSSMFSGATAFNQNLGSWNISNVSFMSSMLNNSGLNVDNYDATLIGWQAQTVKSNVPLGALNLKYCAAAQQRSSLISNSNWNITGDAYACVLPIELLSFTAKAVDNSVLLNWSTATEINNKGFEIEFSTDASNWTTLDFVAGQGNSSSTKSYSYTHQTPTDGNNYYRLKQIDFDASYTYSKIEQVKLTMQEKEEEISIYPNPATVIINIKNTAPYQATLIDVTGKVILSFNNENNIDVSQLANGIYYLQFNNKQTIKFVKQ